MKTVTVRIPVAIDYTGRWYANPSWSEATPEQVLGNCRKQFPGFSSHVLITAEVPIPETVEVQGDVE